MDARRVDCLSAVANFIAIQNRDEVLKGRPLDT